MFTVLDRNVANFLSLGYFSGYNVSLDPYCLYLVDKPYEIMWNTFSDFCFDFSIAFALLMRALIFLTILIIILYHHQACEPHAMELD